MSTPQLSAGTVVDGSYTVGSVVRTRGGSHTYDATDGQGTSVHLTVYDGACFPSTLVLERSLRELRQLQALDTPRIIAVHGCGRYGDGIYEVNDPMPPQTLEEHLRNGALSAADAAGIIVQVGEGLLEAQRVGVVHRNLGAGVIFPSPDGVRLTGFAVGEPHGERSFGPLHAIAPEQVEGKVVDQRTLIYNLAALMHWMMTGAPLFSGDTASVLQQTLHAQLPPNVHGSLVRALGKDPRMRPMILKQFLVELASIGGVQPPQLPQRRPAGPVAAPKPGGPAVASPTAPAAAAGSAKPSTRGWTMFMQAQDDDAPAETPPAQPRPASQPTPPAEQGGAAKPSTRGWTMFMQAQDDDAGTPASQPAPKPTPPPPGEPAKPSTRGWTMFMQAQDDDAPTPDTPQAAAPQPAPPQPAAPAQPAPPQPAAPAQPAAKPSTRGWTMFMEAQDDDAAATPGPDAPAPADPGPGAPQPAQQAAPPVAAADAPSKPSTRGWTMFMKEEGEGSEASAGDAPATPAPAAAPEPAAGPAQPAAEQAGSAAPSSRGWTMFMEPGAKPGAAAPSAEPPAAAQASAPEPAAPEQEAPDTPSGGTTGSGTKRGWTMFMDTPLSKAPADIGGPPTPATGPALDGASDNKGWTVFGEPAPGIPAQAQPPDEAPPAQAPPVEATPSPSAQSKTVIAPGASATPATPARGKTVIAPGLQAPAHPPPDAPAGTTVVAEGARPAMPDTMYFKKGESEPERIHDRSPTGGDIAAPVVAAAQERATPMPPTGTVPTPHAPPGALAPGTDAPVAKGGGGRTFIYIGVGAVVVAAIAGAVFMLT